MEEFAVGRPTPALRPWCAAYQGYRSIDVAPAVHRGLPSPWLTFIITLDDPLVVTVQPDPAQAPATYDALIGGLHTHPALITHDGHQSGIQLLLSPIGARALLGVPDGAVRRRQGDGRTLWIEGPARDRPRPASRWGDHGVVDSPFETIGALMVRTEPGRRALVAVDGVDGSGKSTFAAGLAASIGGRDVVVLHADDFLNPTSIRHARGRDSPEGFWLDTYDLDALRTHVLDPLGPAGDGWYRSRSYDRAADTTVRPPARPASACALVVLEGMFLHRDELRDRWDLSIFLDVGFGETARRMAERDGTDPDPHHASMRRYVEGQRRYFARARPWERASIVVDNTHLTRPRIIDASQVSALG